MKNSRSGAFAFATFLAALLLAPPLTAADTELATEVTLLIGHPSSGISDDKGSLIVPGAVIPVPSDSRLDAAPSSGGSEEAALRATWEAHNRIGQVAGDLVKSLRLSVVELRYRKPLSLAVGELRDLPPPASTSNVRLSIKLLGFNATVASYEVRFFDGSLQLTNTPLTVHRGKQAVVGGLDGEDAPYLFLLIAPAGPVHVDGDIQPPLVIERTPAIYTQEAKRERVEGVVIVTTIIEKDGTVSEVKVLKGLPHGLSEAAVEAIKQWRFEPALMDGEPIAVYYYLTVNFRLSPDEEGEQKP